ncbi:MAG: membrane ATPase/protein kinase [Candidatus Methanofastidiosum methylothiophilum]|uniref:Membrane ATPase/protein kinase n=1 Tax=Candidatus Methanofastidiosum methylothiophilum TaxID=1705564 RepID=A0A150IJS4_9EURY|nr:MAG: membrane ATPase/protein kinase [Candidatus Methanofastidiosum methylthiophilus]KYC47328.1 MAG: membrane ATPase/protein kinase [Candidatus Methanofastidiosum methylthiophilus]KYC49779.1 MAG: membrane ATPase/protein kinase [Candidatus Methanofastidiosum methylthiophilus]
MSSFDELIKSMISGDRRALGKIITLMENDSSSSAYIIPRIHNLTGNAHIVGITGPPGSGKSSIVDKLVSCYRKDGLKVGVIAIDPTSPFTGGAILGDRIRMKQHYTDRDVFIRSMATRGNLGGLSEATGNTIKALDAFGKDVIIIETVGAGQVEVDIVKVADTVIVVSVPSMGDSVQTLKAGIMEIGDIFAVNKADIEGVEKCILEIRMMLELSEKKEGWIQPIIKTYGNKDEGANKLYEAIKEHNKYLIESGHNEKKRIIRGKTELVNILQNLFIRNLYKTISEEEMEELAKKIANREKDPYMIIEELIPRLKKFV